MLPETGRHLGDTTGRWSPGGIDPEQHPMQDYTKLGRPAISGEIMGVAVVRRNTKSTGPDFMAAVSGKVRALVLPVSSINRPIRLRVIGL